MLGKLYGICSQQSCHALLESYVAVQASMIESYCEQARVFAWQTSQEFEHLYQSDPSNVRCARPFVPGTLKSRFWYLPWKRSVYNLVKSNMTISRRMSLS